jgi:hypothetical protein
MCHLHSGSIWQDLRHVVVVLQVGEVEVGVKLVEGRLRLGIYAKGREVWLWLSTLASHGSGDSNVWSLLLCGKRMTRTPMWQRSVRKRPRLVEVTVGAKLRIEVVEWRA